MNHFDQRRLGRSPIAVSAYCRTTQGSRNFVALVNLSIEGCCVLTKNPVLAAGQKVFLRPSELSGLYATVRWTKNTLAGLQFENPLYPAVYEHLARIHARPADAPEVATQAADSQESELPPSLLKLLLHKIEVAEGKSTQEESVLTAPYQRLKETGRRPGLSQRKTDETVLQLFLG